MISIPDTPPPPTSSHHPFILIPLWTRSLPLSQETLLCLSTLSYHFLYSSYPSSLFFIFVYFLLLLNCMLWDFYQLLSLSLSSRILFQLIYWTGVAFVRFILWKIFSLPSFYSFLVSTFLPHTAKVYTTLALFLSMSSTRVS